MFLATGILSKLMMIMMNRVRFVKICREMTNVKLVTRFASHVTEDELRTSMANSSNWINAEKQLEKQRSPVIPSG